MRVQGYPTIVPETVSSRKMVEVTHSPVDVAIGLESKPRREVQSHFVLCSLDTRLKRGIEKS